MVTIEKMLQNFVDEGFSPQEAEVALYQIYGIKVDEKNKSKTVTDLIFENFYKDKKSKRLEWNPIITEVEENWKKYGFKDKKEAKNYLWGWIFFNGLIGRKEYTLKGISTVEELLEKFSIKNYRQDMAQRK